MRITMIDDSVPFDGGTPATAPLGGVEKAFASLASALAGRRHKVEVFNRTLRPATVEGVEWRGWDAPRPEDTDLLIVHRRPSLFDAAPKATKSVLLVAGHGEYLERPQNRLRLSERKPVVAFLSRRAMDGWENEEKLRLTIVPPGVRAAFIKTAPPQPAEPPRAVVTSNPLHGLDWLLRLWTGKIAPVVPAAELHVFSAALAKGHAGGPVAPDYEPVLERARAAEAKGVRLRMPQADPAMAEEYRTARVHLYPGVQSEAYCYSLADSQAVGLPAVARPRGGTRELVFDDTSGFIGETDDAFANAALRLLSDRGTFDRLSLGARSVHRNRDWDTVAAEYEALL